MTYANRTHALLDYAIEHFPVDDHEPAPGDALDAPRAAVDVDTLPSNGELRRAAPCHNRGYDDLTWPDYAASAALWGA